MTHEPDWVIWSRRLQAIAQTGLTYCHEEYDRERYRQISQIAAEIMERYSEADLSYIMDFFARDDGYATPKVDVRGAVFRDDEILLVQERLDGLWTLPGGWADVNDSPSGAVEREIHEESGFVARTFKLAMVLDKSLHNPGPSPRHTYKLFFLCELLGGEALPSYETIAVSFFGLDNLPALSQGRVTEKQIERLYAHHHDRSMPTDFD